MTRTELPWLLWGRLVRPFPFAASLACVLMSANIWLGTSAWGTTDTLSQMTAVGGVAGAVLLWGGWWLRSSALMQHGLMITAIIFAMRAATILMLESPVTAALSACWTVAAAGAWLLERTTADKFVGRGRVE